MTLAPHRRPPLPPFLSWPGLVATVVLAVAYRLSEGDVRALFGADARRTIVEFAGGFFPPAHSTEFLSFLVRPLLETVAVAVLGMALALAFAAPLSFLATSPRLVRPSDDPPSPSRTALWALARTVLNLMRSIPELVWALVFVRAVGMGPAAGILAIGVAYGGVLGKVFAEVFESTPSGPAQTLACAGAPPARAFALGVVPTALPVVASYALYRFDCALRASAVLGLVGAGGLGLQIELSLKMFAYDEVAAMILSLLVLVAGADLLSQVARRRLCRDRGLLPVGLGALRARAIGVALFGAVVTASAWALELPWGDLLSLSVVRSLGAFGAGMWPPAFDPAFLRTLPAAVLTTLAVSVLGTAIAAVLGLLLAYPAAYRVHDRDGGETATRARRIALAAIAGTARGFLNLCRTLPELLWALVLIFAVGLGPFAGALALGLHTAGVLGRLYAEVLEEVPSAPRAALRAAGASAAAGAFFAVLPQAMPQLIAYTLYRWEVNIRASAVLGVVGAGGIGGLLHVSLNLFQHHRTLTLLLVIVLLVTAVDLFSGALRRRVLEGPAARAVPRQAEVPAVAEAW